MKFMRYLPIIGIALFIYIIWSTGPQNIIEVLKKINPYYFFAAVASGIVIAVLRAARWKIIIDSYDKAPPLKECTLYWLIGYAIGLITPGKLGDFTRALYLRESQSISFGRSLATVVMDRVLDIFILFCLLFIGLSKYSGDLYRYYSGILLIAFAILAFVILRKNMGDDFIKTTLDHVIPENARLRINLNFYEFKKGINLIIASKVRFVVAISLSLIAWIGDTLTYYFLALALNLQIPYLHMIFVVPAIVFVEILPISISGLGTRDAALIYLLSYNSIHPEMAISLSLSILITNYFLGVLGILLWFKKPIKI